MRLPTESQWARYSALCARLAPLAAPERAAVLEALRAAGAEEPQVLSLVAVHCALPPDPDRLRHGERLGPCTLEEPLGAGGMGIVYRAQQHLGPARRPVAVKLIHPALLQLAREEVVARFLTELHTLVTLQHEGIARIYDGGMYEDPHSHEQMPYLVMELVRGGLPLTTYASDYALSWQERLPLFLRVCRAMQYAHEHRVVHRDLKPANILVDHEGRPFVIDFGLAQVCDALLPGAHLAASGTPAYMSPEQISEAFGPVSDKSDVYALGLILYELLTAQLPYTLPHHGTVEQVRQVITETAPLPLSQYDQAYCGELEALVAATLAKRPAERPSVAALRSHLERYLQKLPPETNRPTTLRSPQSTHAQPETYLLDTALPTAGHGQPPPPRRWPDGSLGQKRLVVGAALLLLLAGATATLFWPRPLLPVRPVPPPELVPAVSLAALASQALAQEDWSQAEVLLQRLVQQTEPQIQSQGYAGLAAAALARGEAQQALDLAAQAEALDAEIAYSHVIRGHILWEQGKLGAARLAYRTATARANTFPWQQAMAANRLGRIYAAEGFLGTALQYYDRAINLSPQLATVYINKAQVLEQMDRRPEAVELYRQAAQMDADSPLAAVLLRRAERQQQLAQDGQQQAALAQQVATLLRTHAEGRPPENPGDDWTSAPLTLAVLGVQRQGALAPQAGAEEFLSYSLAQACEDSGRIRLIEPALLEMLLVELQRSAADLADLQIAVQVGNILAARLIATGTITRSRTMETLSVSLVETATDAVRAGAEVSGTPDTFAGMVAQLVHTLLQQVRQVYPLQGRIVHINSQGVMLNIGTDHGVTPGLRLQVLGDADPESTGSPMALIEVTTTAARRSQARIVAHSAAVQPGRKVQEVRQP
jgi:serine/threonine protein kinase/tetratricopeptide (TPR) repeat protein